MADRFNMLEDDVTELKGWLARHEERHSDDSRMLQLVLERSEQSLQHLESHSKNHHGRASLIKQSGGIAAALAVLGALAELLRYFFA